MDSPLPGLKSIAWRGAFAFRSGVLRTAVLVARRVGFGASLAVALCRWALLGDAPGISAGRIAARAALLQEFPLLALELLAQFALALIITTLQFLQARVHAATVTAGVAARHRRAVALHRWTETIGARAAGRRAVAELAFRRRATPTFGRAAKLWTRPANFTAGAAVHGAVARAITLRLRLVADFGRGTATFTVTRAGIRRTLAIAGRSRRAFAIARTGAGAAFTIARAGFGAWTPVTALRLRLIAAFAFAVRLVALGATLFLGARHKCGGRQQDEGEECVFHEVGYAVFHCPPPAEASRQ